MYANLEALVILSPGFLQEMYKVVGNKVCTCTWDHAPCAGVDTRPTESYTNQLTNLVNLASADNFGSRIDLSQWTLLSWKVKTAQSRRSVVSGRYLVSNSVGVVLSATSLLLGRRSRGVKICQTTTLLLQSMLEDGKSNEQTVECNIHQGQVLETRGVSHLSNDLTLQPQRREALMWIQQPIRNNSCLSKNPRRLQVHLQSTSLANR